MKVVSFYAYSIAAVFLIWTFSNLYFSICLELCGSGSGFSPTLGSVTHVLYPGFVPVNYLLSPCFPGCGLCSSTGMRRQFEVVLRTLLLGFLGDMRCLIELLISLSMSVPGKCRAVGCLQPWIVTMILSLIYTTILIIIHAFVSHLSHIYSSDIWIRQNKL